MNEYKFSSYELRPYQAEAYESIRDYIKSLPILWKKQKSLTGSFIEASVGAGKTARELFDISKKDKWIRASWCKFVNDHVCSKVTVQKLSRCYDPKKAVVHASDMRSPIQVTHRVNAKGFDIISRKVF